MASAHVRDAAAHRAISERDIGQAAIHLLFRVAYAALDKEIMEAIKKQAPKR